MKKLQGFELVFPYSSIDLFPLNCARSVMRFSQDDKIFLHMSGLRESA